MTATMAPTMSATMSSTRSLRRQALLLACALALPWVALAQGTAASAPQQRHPDVLQVRVKAAGGNRFDFDVTVSSPYDSARRYADGFHVRGTDGTVHGERTLWHDHADEQPFTRDLYGVAIPPGVRFVLVQARDQQFGYGGQAVRVALPGR